MIFAVVTVIGYALTVACLFGFKIVSEPVAEVIGFPVSFGYYGYKFIGGNDNADFVENNEVLFFTIILLAPVIFYSIVAYVLISLYSRLLLPKPEDVAPPVPPERFD
jgi:hypothetical protein